MLAVTCYARQKLMRYYKVVLIIALPVFVKLLHIVRSRTKELFICAKIMFLFLEERAKDFLSCNTFFYTWEKSVVFVIIITR